MKTSAVALATISFVAMCFGSPQSSVSAKAVPATAKVYPAAAKVKGKVAGKANTNKYVSGVIYNNPFQMATAYISRDRLMVRSLARQAPSGITKVALDYRTGFEIIFPMPERMVDQTFSIQYNATKMLVDNDEQNMPSMVFYIIRDKYPEIIETTEPYQLSLTLYKPSKGMLPGFVDIVTKGATKTHVRGYFYAKIVN